MIRVIEILDAQITNPNDELFPLQKKYNVKISRGGKWGSVYIKRTNKFIVRVGHPMNAKQKQSHIPVDRDVWTSKVTKEIVENTIKKYFR